MNQRRSPSARCRACSAEIDHAARRHRYCAGCRERLAALHPDREFGAESLFWLVFGVVSITGLITLTVVALAVLPVVLAGIVGPLGFLAYFLVFPAGAALGEALERFGLRVPTRRRKVL